MSRLLLGVRLAEARFKEAHEELINLVRDVADAIKRNLKVCWTASHRETVRAAIRVATESALRRYELTGYEFAAMLERVIAQTEGPCRDWPLAA